MKRWRMAIPNKSVVHSVEMTSNPCDITKNPGKIVTEHVKLKRCCSDIAYSQNHRYSLVKDLNLDMVNGFTIGLRQRCFLGITHFR